MKGLRRKDKAFLNLHQTPVCYANEVPLKEDGGKNSKAHLHHQITQHSHFPRAIGLGRSITNVETSGAGGWAPRKVKAGVRAAAAAISTTRGNHADAGSNVFREASFTSGVRRRLGPAFISLRRTRARTTRRPATGAPPPPPFLAFPPALPRGGGDSKFLWKHHRLLAFQGEVRRRVRPGLN